MINVLVLCHGNINRSALSGAILNEYQGLNVVSAGFINPGKKAAKRMREVAPFFNLNLDEHRSQVVTEEMIKKAHIIIYMDGGNLKRLEEIISRIDTPVTQNIFCLGQFLQPRLDRIPDPHFLRKGDRRFAEIVDLIVAGSHNFANALIAETNLKSEVL